MIYEDTRIALFRLNRRELFDYIEHKVVPTNKKVKVIHAPVKSGKRGMVEIFSLLDKESNHIFLTALHRVADKTQREELTKFGIDVYSVNNARKKDKCIKHIDELLIKQKKIKIHLDELDFGCGNKQLLENIWEKYKTNPNVHFILYSATIEVAKNDFLVLNNIDDFHECEKFTPPSTYFGIKRYLQVGRFIEAMPFVTYNENKFDITDQGENLIGQLKNNTLDITNKRHIGILRLAGNFKINRKQVSQFETMKNNKDSIEEEYGIRLKFVGSNDNNVEWDNQKYWEELTPTIPFIIVINQVSGRSTEWKCHPYIVWYHTLRTPETPIGTIIQDQERPVYYVTNYDDEIDIVIYGDLACAEYSAGLITSEQMVIKSQRKFNSRLNTKKQTTHVIVNPPLYYNKWEEIPIDLRKGSLSTHVNEDNILKPQMWVRELVKENGKKVFKRTQYEITPKNWDKCKQHQGFYMTNIRSSRTDFIKGKNNKTAVWFKSDILNELNEGIDAKNRIRINLIYEDGETDPNKYIFIVRVFKEEQKCKFLNSTMYNK